jgi:hypothetical protein
LICGRVRRASAARAQEVPVPLLPVEVPDADDRPVRDRPFGHRFGLLIDVGYR